MKKQYNTPKLDAIALEVMDILTLSGVGGVGGDRSFAYSDGDFKADMTGIFIWKK